MIKVIVIPVSPIRGYKDPYREAVSRYFKNKGFRIWCGSGFCVNSGLNVISIHPEKDTKNYCTKSYGSPDLWITPSTFDRDNKGDWSLIETKNEGDHLTKQQLDWLIMNGHLVDTYIAVPTKRHPVLDQLRENNIFAGISTKRLSDRKW